MVIDIKDLPCIIRDCSCPHVIAHTVKNTESTRMCVCVCLSSIIMVESVCSQFAFEELPANLLICWVNSVALIITVICWGFTFQTALPHWVLCIITFKCSKYILLKKWVFSGLCVTLCSVKMPHCAHIIFHTDWLNLRLVHCITENVFCSNDSAI